MLFGGFSLRRHADTPTRPYAHTPIFSHQSPLASHKGSALEDGRGNVLRLTWRFSRFEKRLNVEYGLPNEIEKSGGNVEN
jgi:hypothetical protein